MTTDAKTTRKRAKDRGRVVYRLTGDQFMKMIECGIIDGAGIELWDGILYRMIKDELHNIIVMATADVLRRSIPREYHVREEKSSKDGGYSLPEPDVAVARGRLGDSLPDPPTLEQMAIVVEVDHHTSRSDGIVRFSRYAERGIPVYWIIKAERRFVEVYDTPKGRGKKARYTHMQSFSGTEEIPIVIDGREVGRIGVAELFPPEEQP